jgi:hypothetical protein
VTRSGVTMLLASGMFCGEVSKIFVFFFEEYILSTHRSVHGPVIKWPYRMKQSAQWRTAVHCTLAVIKI